MNMPVVQIHKAYALILFVNNAIIMTVIALSLFCIIFLNLQKNM